MKKSGFKAYRVPMLLVALSLIPCLGGLARLHSLSGSVPVTLENARFVAAPAPILIHIVAATLYSLLGAFQFSRGLRLRWPAWHRRAGRILVAAGLLSALSGVWMTLAYAIPGSLQGPFLYGVRLAVGLAMAAAIVLGLRSILRRDIPGHEAWMIRAYALGQGAGTQAVLMLPLILIAGEFLGFKRDIVMTVAWALNLAVAEWLIRQRKPAPRPVPTLVSALNSPG
jgi:hypothetical protein